MSHAHAARSGGPMPMAHPGRIIYVQTIFDTETILKNYGKSTTCSSPTWLPHPGSGQSLMYMITNWANQISGQGTGNLELQAKPNDIVNWRSMSLSSNTGDAAVIYAIQTDTPGVIGIPTLMQTRPTVPILKPPGGCPASYTTEQITDSYWYSIIAKPGSTTYKVFFFILTEDSSGKPVQYFYAWDPKITVVEV